MKNYTTNTLKQAKYLNNEYLKAFHRIKFLIIIFEQLILMKTKYSMELVQC